MKWIRMNYRHQGWRNGYRYFATWSYRLGMYSGGLGHLVKWLTEQYGTARLEIHGPMTQEQMDRATHWRPASLGHYPNPAWGIDMEKRRVYVTEETLLWARLLGKID